VYKKKRRGGAKNWCKKKEEKRKKKVKDHLFINGKKENYEIKRPE